MIKRDKLVSYINSYLSCTNFKDYAPNGLQVEGCDDIKKICTSVTAGKDSIEKAIENGADALLVHHGYFWRGEKPVVTGVMKRRLSLLLQNDLNLLAYHLPLDAHKLVGNNACLAKKFNVKNITQHSINDVPDILWMGELDSEISPHNFEDFLTKILQRPMHLLGGDKKIKKIAWCSGAAQDLIEEAAFLGADAYISGESSERTFYLARELGIHYFCCGHHATERYGIQALGKHLSDKFKLEHHFIDSNNPV